MPLIWPPDRNIPPADVDQKSTAEIFRQTGNLIIEAPPGTGKTFQGIYLSLCAYRLGWTTNDSPTLFLTFSKNAKVQIEQEIQRFKTNSWINSNEEKAFKVSNFHSFYFEMIRKKSGIWGCSKKLQPSSIQERQERLKHILRDEQYNDKDIVIQANLIYALKRFEISDLTNPATVLTLDDNDFRKLIKNANVALRNGRPQYDDFAPLFLNLLEICPEFVEWIRVKYPVIIIDEFQDTDVLQLEILKIIKPTHLVILYDRYQMIYEWRGARLDRIEQVKSYFSIPSSQERHLTKIHRCGNQIQMAEFIQQLRSDDLQGNNLSSQRGQSWLSINSVNPIRVRSPIPIENRCLTKLRFLDIDYKESTAILTRTNYLADFLYEHLRIRPKKGKFYPCRWIGGDNNPEEKIRDVLWKLRLVNDKFELGSWIGSILDLLLPQQTKRSLNISFSIEFFKDPEQIFKRRTKPVFLSILETWKPLLAELSKENLRILSICIDSVIVTAKELIEKDGYLDYDIIYYLTQLKKSIENFDKTKFVGEEEWESLCDYLESSLLKSSFVKLRGLPKGLYIMTVHQSKGREFDRIILPWLSSKGEPNKLSDGRKFNSKYKYQKLEDRKLLYVALTRAKRNVTIVFPEDDQSLFLSSWKLI